MTIEQQTDTPAFTPTTTKRDTAMLVTPRITIWGASKRKSQLSAETAAAHSMNAAAVTTDVKLVRDILRPITSLKRSIKTYHAAMTVPFYMDGTGMLPCHLFFEYMQGMAAYRQAWDAEITRLSSPDVLTYIAQEAQRNAGDAFDPDDIPQTPEEMRARFDFQLVPAPIPQSHDIRVDLDDAVVAELRQEADKRLAETYTAATANLWGRLYECVTKSLASVESYAEDASGKVQKTFRDSAVENIRTLVRLVPALNLAGDTPLNEMVSRIEDELCRYDAEELRDGSDYANGADLRVDFCAHATAILRDIEAVVSAW